MELSIVILNWNAAPDTIRCVGEVTAWERLKPAIWVVDNASSDDSPEAIERQCPNVHLICNDDNLGFAGGTNRGVAASLAAGDSPIFLLNNDASIAEEDVIRLYETLQQDERIGLVGPLIYDAEQKECLLSAGGKNPVLHHHPRMMRVPQGKTVFAVGYVLGTAALVRAEVFRRVGLLDEGYFFIAEMADFCRRARQHGYATVNDARARAFHALGRSSAFRDTLYVYYIVRNRFLYIRKFYKGLRMPLIGFWTLYSLVLGAKLRLEGNSITARAVLLGLGDGLRGRYGGQNERVLAELAR